MRNNLLLLTLLLLFILSACVSRPDKVLSDNQMAPVLADMQLAEAYVESLPGVRANGQSERVIEYILKKHGLTREQFDSTMSWYGKNVDDYYKLCELTEKELQKRKGKIAGASSIEIETSDIWPYSRQMFISPLSGAGSFDFDIPTSAVGKGDRVNMIFKLNNSASGDMLIGVEYDKGPKSYLSKTIRESKRLDLTIQTDSSRNVTRVFGNFLLQDSRRLPLWLDSIYVKTLPYDSLEYFKIRTQKSMK